MADENTTNYSFTKPEPGASEDSWGIKLNANWDSLDSTLYAALNGSTAIAPNLTAGSWEIGGTAVTVTAAEINRLDGLTASTAELNKLDSATLDLAAVTATASEVNVLDGSTATTADLNKLADVTATAAELNLLDGRTAQDFFPSGGIIMWSGSVGSIPSGWALCNGANGTPDLRNRFVVGAGGSYSPGNTGGANSVTLTEAQMPSHTHSGSADSASLTGTIGRTPDDQANDTGGVFSQTSVSSLNLNAALAGSINAFVTEFDGTHTHTLSVNSTGGGGSHENRPPYYALAYIMKM